MTIQSERKSFNTGKNILPFVLITCLLTAIDQFTKMLARKYVRLQTISVLSGIFELRYLENRGAAFGILQNRQWIFILFAICITVAAAWIYPRLKKGRRYQPLRLICCLLAAGALGNLLDRVFLHYVVDFLYFSLIDFPIFNVADVYVSVGCILLFLLVLFRYNGDEQLLDKG